MSVRQNPFGQASASYALARPVSSRLLLGGVSALALIVGASAAKAGSLSSALATSPAAQTSAVVVGAQAAAGLAAQSQANMARSASTLKAALAAQAAARLAATQASSSVANGLNITGLVPDSGLSAAGQANPVTSWVNATTPSQTIAADGQAVVTIQQTGQYALLNWQSFNIGKQTTLSFQQGGTDWVALNKVSDPSAAPSQILGQINAQGGVYVLNQNGVIFGGSAQVNVHSLIASSLNLNDTYATDVSKSNFLNGKGILATASAASFRSVDSAGSSYAGGDILVGAGAQITADNGQVLLLAPSVRNDGQIATSSGQTVLFAGSDLWLGTGDSYTRGFVVKRNPSAPSSGVTGLDYSSMVPGTLVNNGVITATEGNITLVGGTVSQNGVLYATTSTTKNGSIVVRAETGTLELGGINDNPLYASLGIAPQASLVQIEPAADASLVTDTQAIANSSISLLGVNVDVRGMIQLRGYDVTNINDHLGGITIGAFGTASEQGRVVLEDGSLIDAAGTTDAVASASRNSVKVELRVNELRDQPVIKDSPLYQKTIYVDASVSGTRSDGTTWQGTPIADASAWIAKTERSLNERFMNGAPVNIGGAVVDSLYNLQSASQIVQKSGSVINVSGGYMTFTPGLVAVTTLQTQDGRTVSVSSADPMVSYASLCCQVTVTHNKWGVTQSFNTFSQTPGYESQGYIQGGKGGSLTLTTSAAVMGGTVISDVVKGQAQRAMLASTIGAALSINGVTYTPGNTDEYLNLSADYLTVSDDLLAQAKAWTSSFSTATDLNAMLTANAAPSNSIYLSSDWVNSGFGSVNLSANNAVLVAPSNQVVLPAGGSFAANASRVDVRSSITVPGGSITLAGLATTTAAEDVNSNGSTSSRGALVTVGSGVTLSTAGLVTKDNQFDGESAIAPNGGAIALYSFGDVELGQGSVLDVSGGGYVTKAGKITSGNGGSLTLLPGLGANLRPLIADPPPRVAKGYLILAGGTLAKGQLLGFGTGSGKGGTLNMTSSAVATIRDGGTTGDSLMKQTGTATDRAGNDYQTLDISTNLFTQAGFSTFNITAAGITVPAEVTLAPTVLARSLGADQSLILGEQPLQPYGVRKVASLTLVAKGDLWNKGGYNAVNTPGYSGDDLSADATYGLNVAGTVSVDPTGSIVLKGEQIAVISGTVNAPAGTISVSGGTYKAPFKNQTSQSSVPLLGEGLWLTGTGRLLATGTVVSVPQSQGGQSYDVLQGGTVNIGGGDIVLAKGSLVDVSGASGSSSLVRAGDGAATSSGQLTGNIAYSSNSLFNAVSSGGSINVAAVLGAVLEGTLAGRSGGTGAAGGTLSVSLAGHGGVKEVPGVSPAYPTDYWPDVESTYITLMPSVGDSAILPGDKAVAGRLNAKIPVSVQTITDGGFGSLLLDAKAPLDQSVAFGDRQGYVTFSSSADIALSLAGKLTIKSATVIVPNGRTETLAASYINWQNAYAYQGNYLNGAINPGNAIPGSGTGVLTFDAGNVDLIGRLAVQGAQTTTFLVGGDIRLTGQVPGVGAYASFPQLFGMLISDGDLTFKASQIYPSTDSAFALSSLTKIAILGNGTAASTPLSVGGVLNVLAPVIDQEGTLRAPGGVINLGSPSQSDTDNPVLRSLVQDIGLIKFTTSQQVDFLTGQRVTITGANGSVIQGYVETYDSTAGAADNLTVQVTSYSGTPTYASTSPIVLTGTSSLTIGANSVTSVSMNGNVVPFGTITNGTGWYYNPVPGNLTTNLVVSQPSAKAISLGGGHVSVAQGAVIDASGGGDIYASEFVPGTGGSKNVFAATGVYAVIPGYSGLSPYDPSLASSLPDTGRQVYLNGGNGLAAGVYTLLPAAYAQLAGAYLIKVTTSPSLASLSTTGRPQASTVFKDGSVVESGYFIAQGVADEHWSVFSVSSSAVARRYSEIKDSYGNSFFAAKAAAAGVSAPRLSRDGGQLSIAAQTSLSFQGTGLFAAASGGLNGLADISADQILVVDSSVAGNIVGGSVNVQNYKPGTALVGGEVDPDVWNPIVLAASDLNKLGVESLLLGGARSFQTDGVHLKGSANQVVIANDSNEALSLPDVQLIAIPRKQSNLLVGSGSVTSFSVLQGMAGTGQVVIAPHAAISVSDRISSTQTPTYIFSTLKAVTPTLIQPSNIFYDAKDIQKFYSAVLANEVGYVRVSGGGLADTVGGNPSYEGQPTGSLWVSTNNMLDHYVLPTYAIAGSVSIGAGASFTPSKIVSGTTQPIDSSLMVYVTGTGSIGNAVAVGATSVGLRGNLISLGTNSVATGLALDQAVLSSLAGVKTLRLTSASSIDFYGALTLGRRDDVTGQPILTTLTLDAAGLLEKGTSGAAQLTAEQVVLQNSLGSAGPVSAPVVGTSLSIVADDVTGIDPSGVVTGLNNGRIALGAGSFSLAGFSSVSFKSSGDVVATGDGGSLLVQAPLAIEAPRVTAGTVTKSDGLTKFGVVSYSITASDQQAVPTYYDVSLTGGSVAAPALSSALLGNSLKLSGRAVHLDTEVALPGGLFSVSATGDIWVGSGADLDVGGRSLVFSDVVASIGGGSIKLATTGGGVSVQAGARVDVGDSSTRGAVNKSSAGTLLLSAPTGGVLVAGGTLFGAGRSDDSSGTALIDSKSLDGGLTYDALAEELVRGGFAKEWNIRARAGDIAMSGASASTGTRARKVTVSADTGNISVSGRIDASGATGGKIALWAGKNLVLASTAVLNAHGQVADANGKGGQVWLGASQSGNQAGNLILNVGAAIDVGVDQANAGVSTPVFGGEVTFVTSRNAANDGLNLTVNGGNFASFLTGVHGESRWDGIVLVGNQTYSYNQANLVLTPFVSTAGSVVFNAFLDDASGYGDATYSNAYYTAHNAAGFMSSEAMQWTALGADASGVANGVLVNIRAGIAVKNAGGDITINGDSGNRAGIDLSGSAYAGSVLNTGDAQSLNGHFGIYDEPVILAIRASGNLNFGSYVTSGADSLSYLKLGSLSDGFRQYTNGSLLFATELPGAGASGIATLFDPAAAGAYNGLSGGLGADSASYFLAAGADVNAADPIAVDPNAARGTMTIAGIPGGSSLTTAYKQNETTNYSVTTNPLYLYNYDMNGNITSVTLQNFVDYASLVRTGAGIIDVATTKDLVLQSPLSLLYSAGTGYNVNGTADQPLSGFTQYNGILTITAGASSMKDTLPSIGFDTHGGDVTLAIGRDILGGMNSHTTANFNGSGYSQGVGQDQELPYDMTALGSQLKLQNWYTTAAPKNGLKGLGGFSDLYADDTWMLSLNQASKLTYYTRGGNIQTKKTPGNYQLAWYTWFPFLENTIGSFGGGNISVKAGGSVTNVQFVAPTNARDAGPKLAASSYAYDATVVTNPSAVALSGATPAVGGYTGLYTQGGGDVSVEAGGDIANVYTYVQNGKTLLKSSGAASDLLISTSSGDVTVSAIRGISISDKILQPSVTIFQNTDPDPVTVSGVSLIQNANAILDVRARSTSGSTIQGMEATVLTGLLTSVPTGTLSLQSVGDVEFAVSGQSQELEAGGTTLKWNTVQGLVSPHVQMISAQGDVVNNASFITYPDATGSVDMLAEQSVVLNKGFVISDAELSVMPTLANMVDRLGPYTTVVTAANANNATLAPAYTRIGGSQSYPFVMGGANYLAGQDPDFLVLGGDSFGQLIRNQTLTTFVATNPVVEAQRHGGIHANDFTPARVIALNGDVTMPDNQQNADRDPFINSAKPLTIMAGRDIVNLRLLGQNNSSSDLTRIVAGQDIVYNMVVASNGQLTNFLNDGNHTYVQSYGISIAGPGNLLVQSGGSIDLGTSSGIQSIGNLLNAGLTGAGASITIEAGLGSSLVLGDYAAFSAAFANPALKGEFAPNLALYDAGGNVIGTGDAAWAYLNSLSEAAREILLNRLFFGIMRDSGREHTGAASTSNYELGSVSIDSTGVLNASYVNYQRAYAAIAALFGAQTGSGSFHGGLSSVRTLNGGNISIFAPHGEIEIGLATPPTGFPGYSNSTDPTYALGFGVVTERGGSVSLYAEGNISVNQSRVFTLDGGDLIAVSHSGDIDAGKGAKTVQSIQPPNVSYDAYGNITVTPYGPASGSGLQVLRALPDAPVSNADLVAFVGTVDAGDAGVNISGNLNVAAEHVLNKDNFSTGGTKTGVPVAATVDVGALSAASDSAGSSSSAGDAGKGSRQGSAKAANLPSLISVEVVGYGGSESNSPAAEDLRRRTGGQQGYNPDAPVHVLGHGHLNESQLDELTPQERARKVQLAGNGARKE